MAVKPNLPENLVNQLIAEAGVIYSLGILEGKSEGECFVTASRALVESLFVGMQVTLTEYAKAGKLEELVQALESAAGGE